MDKKQFKSTINCNWKKVCSEELNLQVTEQSKNNFGIQGVIEEVIS